MSLSRKKAESENTIQEPEAPLAVDDPKHQENRKKNSFGKWWSNLLFGRDIPAKMKKEQVKEEGIKKGTLLRKKSLRRSEAPPIALEAPKTPVSPDQMASSLPKHGEEEGPFSGMSGLMSTLKRSLSRKRPNPRQNNFNDEMDDKTMTEELQYFDPLVIPWDETYLNQLRSHRVTEPQIKSLKTIISIYNGTHNWHNYIPGASPDDPRCYLRILNIELSEPKMHEGIEWIRIKVQAKAFARLQVRKMVAFAVMVARTNTPPSVIANSFGYAKIHLPETPACGLILDEPHYGEYNAQALRLGRTPVDFESIKDSVEDFRHSRIHEEIYKHEAKDLQFAKWIRNMDSYSFMYTYFLNQRGVIDRKNLNAIKE